MEIDYDEMMCEWQSQSMEDAIWHRGRKDWWWRVPHRQKQEVTTTTEDLPEYGSPELPY